MSDALPTPNHSPGRLVVTEDLATAVELIDALRPTNERWHGDPLRWIFRGHADERWKLVPSAHRKNSWNAFRPGYDPETANEADRDRAEHAVLRQFGERLDRGGLAIPGKRREELDWLDPESLKPEWLASYFDLAAYAQHNGVPTRLLDFTRASLVAAYFAAQDPPQGAPTPQRFCVWAIDGSFFRLWHSYGPQYPSMKLVPGSRAINANQHAQQGLFATWISFPPPIWTGSGIMTLVDLIEIIARAVAQGEYQNPPPHVTELYARLKRGEVLARKLTVPSAQASTLFKLLANERITAATLFPGPAGVVQSMREAVRHGIVEYDFWST